MTGARAAAGHGSRGGQRGTHVSAGDRSADVEPQFHFAATAHAGRTERCRGNTPPSENPQQGIQINTNGQRFGSNNFMIDGADNNDPVLGIIVMNPAIDSVAEFKYTTGNYDAEYAQAGGAVMQMETKTRHQRLSRQPVRVSAKQRHERAQPVQRAERPAAAALEPVRRFAGRADQEKQAVLLWLTTKVRVAVPEVPAVHSLTAAERNGDFSALGRSHLRPELRQLGWNRPHPVPRTTRSLPTGSPTAAKNLLALLPLPNFGPLGAFNNNYISSGSEAFDSDQFDVRAITT